jgi:4-methyl-5(b-hydroxyethyl)-thiazole monophosphate biosynthesis
MPGSTNLDENAQTDRFVQAAVEADAFLCAICAAPLVLGHRGLLMDHRATCYPGFEDALLGAQMVASGVVRDENRITASGMGLAEAFGLELVAALKGEDTARDLARAIAPYRKGMKSKWGN